MFKYLKFFNKKGDIYNFLFNEDEGYFEGSIYLPEVSVGLIENQHIFIIEEYLDSSNKKLYGLPASNNISPTDNKWVVRWEKQDFDNEIYLYDIEEEFIEEDNKSYPFIQKITQAEVSTADISYSLNSINKKIIDPSSLISESIKINIAFTSNIENVYNRNIIIEDRSGPITKIIAKIKIHGESIGEDERLRLMLDNFGKRFNEEDAFILRGYDIKEQKPDWKSINQKRKELLLTRDEIYSYIGGYKGLINAIRFFEYQDLRVKEYWLNINPDSENYKKYQLFELTKLLENGSRDVKLKNPFTPNPNYKKTSLFSLVYDITRTTGELDEFGIPVTENAFMFTPEEVVIKLFALKEKLKREFLPLNARIIDITGEGIYFERYGINIWQDLLHTNNINIGEWIDFEAFPNNGHIQDLRYFNTKKFPGGLDLPLYRYDNTIEPYEFNQKYPVKNINSILKSIKDFYNDDKNNDLENFGDETGFINLDGEEYKVPVGMPVILKNKSFDITWDELDTSWDSLLNTPLEIKIKLINNTPSEENITLGIRDQLTDNIVSISLSGFPSKEELAEELANQISLSSLYPFSEFNVIYESDKDFLILRDTTKSDVKFGFVSTNDLYIDNIGVNNNDCNFSWDFLDIGQFYEIEWIIQKKSPNPFAFKHRGKICDINEYPVFLPYIGKYTITMNLIDTFNNKSTKYKEDFIEVFPKEIEINGFARFQNREKYTWDDMVNSWDDYAGSSWERIREATDFGEAEIPEYLLDFTNYKYQDIEVFNNNEWIKYDGFNINSKLPSVIKNWGTKTIFTWENMEDITWDDMFHTTWEMTSFHPGFLGGFEIFNPEQGDSMTVGPYEAFIFGSGSPHTSPYSLEDAVDQLNNSSLPGISDFTYTIMDSSASTSKYAPSPLPEEFIHAEAKFEGASGYYFINYEGNIQGDIYSFRFPNWLDRPIIEGLQKFIESNPNVNPDYLFLDAIESDIISGKAGTNQYWFNSPDDNDSPNLPGINAGEIMSWYGNASLTSSDIRGFKNDFVAPKGVPIFLVCQHSEVYGKNNFRWILWKQNKDGRTQSKIIEIRNKPFFIWRFSEIGDYSIEIFCKDSNGNEYHNKRNGLIRIINKSEWDNKINKVSLNEFGSFTKELINFI